MLPEPANGWLRYVPAAWPDPGREWTDPARGGLGRSADRWPDRSALAAMPEDGPVWVPPVVASLARERHDWIEQAKASGASLVVQIFPGEEPPGVPCELWVDALAAVLAAEIEKLACLPPGSTLLWPLVAGLTTDVGQFTRACAMARDCGAKAVVPLALRLGPFERRRLAGDQEEAFERLFHGPAPAERDYVRIAAAHGLGGWFARPERSGGSARQARLDRAATILGEIAELRARLQDPAGRSAAMFRAMRAVERGDHDVEALWREGNLGVLPWCDGEIAGVLDDVFRSGRSELRETLWSRYLGTP